MTDRQKSGLIWITTKSGAHIQIDPNKKSVKAKAGQVSWESRPSTKVGILPELSSAPLKQQREFHEAIAKVFHRKDWQSLGDGRLGFTVKGDFSGPGIWEGATSPGGQISIEVPNLTDEVRENIQAYAAVMGNVLEQDAVGWHVADYGSSPEEENGAELNMGRTITEDELKSLYSSMQKFGKESGLSINSLPLIASKTGVHILNFSGKSNDEFFRLIESAVDDSIADKVKDYSAFASDGGLVENDWEDKPNGEGFKVAINKAGGAVAEVESVLALATKKIRKEFAKKYGWSNPDGPKKEAKE